MHRSINNFFRIAISNFLEAIFNIFVFLPYFFSVTTLLKTLFSPWKKVVVHKTIRRFSLNDMLSRMSYNAVSISMGFFMRSSILIFYLLLQITYFLSLITIVPVFVVCLPILYIWILFEETTEEKKARFLQRFETSHKMKQENTAVVQKWGEKLYQEQHKKSEWWKLANLFEVPPLGRDWAVGYTPQLDSYSQDLTHPTYQSHIKHIVGRLSEVSVMEHTLSKNEEANILLVGEEGVGKHAIVDAFAQRIYEGKTNQLLAYKRLLKLNMGKILTEYTDQKQREEFLTTLLNEAVEAKNIIVYIEQLDKYVAAGEGRVDLSTPIEEFGQRTTLQIIGVTSPFFYQKYIVPNDKLTRIFTKLDVFEVSKNQAIQVLLDTTPEFEKRYKLVIPYETVIETIDKSDFFITQLPFPEKAVQLLDMACIGAIQTYHSPLVTPQIVMNVLAEKTHIPVSLTSAMKDRLLHLEVHLLQKIVNQEQAVQQVAAGLRRSFLLMGKTRKPLATFLFLGPTGVGKTEMAKAIAQLFFESEKKMLRFDMSNYQSKEDIEKLIGSMDTMNPGLLTESIRNSPYAVLLLDELEKANKDLLNIFLTILDEGYFTDGYGKRVDCKNLIIVATSNAGSDLIGKAHIDAVTNESENSVINFLMEHHIFSPEFLNRFDAVITFNQLNQAAALQIARSMLRTVTEQIYSLYKVKVQVAETTLKSVIENNYDPTFGARNLERALRQHLEDTVAKIILENKAKEGDTIYL